MQLYSVLYEDTKQGSDAYIENVEMPEYLYPGDSYSMTVTVESNYETDAKLQLLQGTEMVSQTGVHLNKGSNRFVFETEGSRYRCAAVYRAREGTEGHL